MVKIQFRIRDKEQRVIARESLTLRCKLNNGKPWQSEVLQASNSGVIWLEIPDLTFKKFNRRTLRLEVTQKGKVLKHTRSKLIPVHETTYRVDVLVTRESNAGDARNDAQIAILFRVAASNTKSLDGCFLKGAWIGKDGSRRALPGIQLNPQGLGEAEWLESFHKSVDWSQLTYTLEHTSRKFEITSVNGPRAVKEDKYKKNYHRVLDIEVQEEHQNETIDVSGSVVDTEKKPLVGAGVSILFPSVKNQQNRFDAAKPTDDHGQLDLNVPLDFKKPLLSGEHQLMVDADGRSYTLADTPHFKEIRDNSLDGVWVVKPQHSGNIYYSIAGVVTSDDGRPLQGLIVKAFDKGVAKQQLLGSSETNQVGKYHIDYTESDLLKPDRREASLVVQVFSSQQAKKPLAVSPMKQHARRREIIKLVVNRKNYSDATLFDILRQIFAVLELDDKIEGISKEDVILLARDAGLERIIIEQYIKAHLVVLRLSTLLNKPVAAEPVFGIFRAGLEATPAALANARDHKLEQYLTRAVTQKWINQVDPTTAVDAIRPARVKLLLQHGNDWIAALQSQGISEPRLTKVADAWLRSTLPVNLLLDRMVDRGELPAQSGEEMQESLQLFEFSNGNQALLQGLANDYNIKKPQDLARLGAKEWLAIARKYFEKMPEWVKGKTQQEQLDFLAERLQCMVEDAHATAVFAHHWKEDKKLDNAPVQAWLEKNPRFEFKKNTLEKHWEQSGKAPAKKNQPLFLRTERLFQITPDCHRFPVFKALWLSDYQSASDVLDKGRGRFVREISHQGIDDSVANEIYKRAQRLSSRDLLGRQHVPVSLPDRDDSSDNTLVTIEPTIAALFGDKGCSGCSHCISAFSPGAYLIDMLRYLERAGTDAGTNNSKNGLQLLFERRPDIANLRIDCENSDRLMPYIDLVNEILEHIVATSSIPFKAPAEWLVEETLALQTTWSAAELAAHPEHLGVEAYNRLRNPLLAAPWSLPYNLWSDEVRTYLAQISVDRTDLVAILRSDDAPYKLSAVALDRLAIDPAEVVVLSLPANTKAKRLLVWQTAEPAKHLKKLRDFLRRTALSYDETANILATQFVNPTHRKILPADLHNLNTAELNLKPEDDNGLLDRFHRFTRLWRKTGWSTIELDAVMQNLLDGDLNASGLTSIGIIAELHHRYATPLEELASWFGKLNSSGNQQLSSLYQRQFIDGSVNSVVRDGALDLLEEIFRVIGSGASRDLAVTKAGHSHDKWLAMASTDVQGEWTLHPDYGPIVLAGCRVTSTGVERLIQQGLVSRRQGKVPLNLANLSQIFRQASIARSLDLSVEELVDWQRVIGVSLGPERTEMPGPGGSLLLMQIIRQQLDAGITAAGLLYALNSGVDSDLAPTGEAIEQLMTTIRGDLQKAADEFKSDTLGATDQLALWLSLLPSLIVDENRNDVAEALGIIDGSRPYHPGFEPALSFIYDAGAGISERLFDNEAITDPQERLTLAATTLPVDTHLLQQLDLLLQQQEGIDQSQRHELMVILSGLSDATESVQLARFDELLPQIDHHYLHITPVRKRLEAARTTYYDQWVRTPLVLQHLATSSGISEGHVALLSRAVPENRQPLLSRFLSAGFIDAETASVNAAKSGIQRLFRQAALVVTIGIEAGEIEFSLSHAQKTGLFDFSTVGSGDFLRWHNTVTAHTLNTGLRDDAGLYDYFSSMLDGNLETATANAKLAELFEVSQTDLTVLAGNEALSLSDQNNSYLNAVKLERLSRACTYVRQTGIDASQLLKLASPILNSEHANIAKAAVRAKYDETNWREVSEKLRADLRQRQRDALLAFVRTRGGLDLSHEHAYAWYLIDVDMGACYQTSRTKQATASVQQFIQRILLGLERDLSTGSTINFEKEDALEWQWRKNYRVWEANVKVFAYPENWLEPELRDNKTPFFEVFEQELMQGELDSQLAETAVTGYLEQLHEVSNLEIVNCYEDDSSEYRLYVIGRTQDLPHHYYWRSWNRDFWQPWQEIEFEIESDHVIPVIFNNRLYLYWAVFTAEVNQEAVDQTGIPGEIEAIEDRLEELQGSGSGGSIADMEEDIEELQGRLDEILDDNIVDSQELPSYWTLPGLIRSLQDSLDELTAERDQLLSDLIRFQSDEEQAIIEHSFQRIHLNWIVNKSNGWTSKKTVKEPLIGPEGYVPEDYLILGSGSGEELSLYVLVGGFDFRIPSRLTRTVAKVSLSHCSGGMHVDTQYYMRHPSEIFDNSQRLYTQHRVFPTFTPGSGNALTALGQPLLDASDAAPLVAVKHQMYDRAEPFFAHIGERSFFVYKHDAATPGGETGSSKYRFVTHYHPYSCAFLRQIQRFGLKGLYQPDPDTMISEADDATNLLQQLTLKSSFDFQSTYRPDPVTVDPDYPIEKIDFGLASSYGVYNWELFFHMPMLIACRLMQNRNFEQAQQWFHSIFNPTVHSDQGMEQYWQIKPFYYAQKWDVADDDLDDQLERIDDDEALSLESMIDEWEANPFQPHLIARFRIVAYMRMTVMKYLDNLIAWGDSLFKRDTMESINEATQLYLLAAMILGQRPLVIDNSEAPGERFTVEEFLANHAVRQLPPGSVPPSASDGFDGQGAQGILAVLDQFCLPFNDSMLEYWDKVGDRLFKIRHCMNIQGMVRQLPLYQPPIDPALLVKAAAAGADISSVLNNLSAPRPNYRFSYLGQKTAELIAFTQSLGGQLLAALEKKDAEALQQLRAENEVELLKLGKAIRNDAIEEARKNMLALQQGERIVQLRRDFYASRDYINTGESLDLTLRAYSWYLRTLSQIAQAAVTPLEAIPGILTGGAGAMGSPLAITLLPQPAKPASSGAKVLSVFADLTQTGAGMAQTIGQFDRRQEEWDHQVELAQAELEQFDKQVAAAEIRLAMAEKELANLEKQIEQAEEAEAFLKEKFTNTQLYSWMVTQISTLYFQTYQLAFDMAKRTERCYQHELGIPDTNFIQFGYWDSLKKGLMAGERLQLDVKRMESSYLEYNSRELELSKTVSLSSINPEALIRLTETGECFLNLPEAIFDLDYPGHYFRRVKNISLTIPAITGPYTSVSCTLTLLSDKYRKEARQGDEEELFEWNLGAIQSIATSSAQGDSGLFQLDFRDERYLPFEYAGVISSWKLNLPNPNLAQFDYSTISDVLIHVSYTARNGGQVYRQAVEEHLVSALNSLVSQDSGFPQVVSLKSHFPDAWTQLEYRDSQIEPSFDFEITLEHFPYFVRRRLGAIDSVKLIVVEKEGVSLALDGENVTLNPPGGSTETLQQDPVLGLPSVHFGGPIEVGAQSLTLPTILVDNIDSIKDILLICTLQIA